MPEEGTGAAAGAGVMKAASTVLCWAERPFAATEAWKGVMPLRVLPLPAVLHAPACMLPIVATMGVAS